ncbi:mate-domain-containing protein [Scenedesmus sp. NREL 46B-D3]|nr:mate-domain-containing protein [Scenedesmus sp. NREL 46B-D3]
MTLTDTIFIGQCAGTKELAALGPANIIFSFCQYIFLALQIAAISLISDDLRRGFTKRAEHTLSVAIGLAAMSGVAVMLLMEVAADQLIGCTGADPVLVPLAASYMRTRALAQPAVLLTMVCQGGQLAQQDSRTPALAVALSVAVNVCSNLVAVAWLGLGLQGAATTTVTTQVLGCAVLLLVARRSGGLSPGLRLPSWQDLRAFAATMGPLGVTYLCKNLCYILLQVRQQQLLTAAASLSWVQLAAHQAVFSVWNLLAFTTAPLEQAALAFVPAAAPGWQQRSTVQLLMSIAVVIGITCGLLAAGVPLLAPQLLTRDPLVWQYMSPVAPLALVAMLLTAADVGASGVLLARRDLAYVARAYCVTLCSLWLFMWGCSSQPWWGLQGVWASLVLFFALRCCQSLGRLLWLGLGAGRDKGRGLDGLPAA